MSGMSLTVVGTVIGFVVLFGAYLSMRYDFVFSKRPDESDPEPAEPSAEPKAEESGPPPG